MNTIICNRNMLVIDLAGESLAGVQRYEMNSFMTPFGLVYPIAGTWGLVRALQSATTPQDLLNPVFVRYYLSGVNGNFIYLDWNGKVWLCTLHSDRTDGITLRQVGVAQTDHFTYYAKELDSAELSAVNSALLDVGSMADALKTIRAMATEIVSVPHVIDLKAFKALRPEGAMNLSSIRCYPPEAQGEKDQKK